MTDLIIGGLVLAPAAITFILKSNAATAFLVLCASFVLSTSAVGDLKQLLNQMDLTVTETTLALAVLAIPLVLTLLLVRAPVGKGPQFMLQLLAALGAGGLLALSVAPLLGGSAEFDLESSKVWDKLQNLQAAVIGAGALLSFLLVWLNSFKSGGHKKKH